MLNTTFPDALMRHFIGLDHMNRLAQAAQQAPNYPPFNIEQTGDDSYVLSLAVAGFSESEISISLLNSALTIKGQKTSSDVEGSSPTVYLHRGLSLRDFERTFTLAEHVQVLTADMRDGLLTISLARVVPESAKPKIIPISQPTATVTLGNKASDKIVGEVKTHKTLAA